MVSAELFLSGYWIKMFYSGLFKSVVFFIYLFIFISVGLPGRWFWGLFFDVMLAVGLKCWIWGFLIPFRVVDVFYSTPNKFVVMEDTMRISHWL